MSLPPAAARQMVVVGLHVFDGVEGGKWLEVCDGGEEGKQIKSAMGWQEESN